MYFVEVVAIDHVTKNQSIKFWKKNEIEFGWTLDKKFIKICV